LLPIHGSLWIGTSSRKFIRNNTMLRCPHYGVPEDCRPIILQLTSVNAISDKALALFWMYILPYCRRLSGAF
jgi:hypothetical protein